MINRYLSTKLILFILSYLEKSGTIGTLTPLGKIAISLDCKIRIDWNKLYSKAFNGASFLYLYQTRSLFSLHTFFSDTLLCRILSWKFLQLVLCMIPLWHWSIRVTVAWYITDGVRHLPSKWTRVIEFLQLHVLGVCRINGIVVRFQYRFIMSLNNLVNVRHATVADLDGVSIEHFMKNVIRREAFVQKSKKLFTNIGFNSITKWWVEPCNVTLSIPFHWLITICRLWVIFKLKVISTCIQRIPDMEEKLYQKYPC